MRKYLLGLFAVVMAVSLSAFTSVKTSKEVGKSAELYWFEYSLSTGTGAYLDFGERSEFIIPTCDLTIGTDCRRGYPLSALVDESDPDLGVISDNANTDQIRKQ